MKQLLLFTIILFSATACAPEKVTNQVEDVITTSTIENVSPVEFKKLVDSKSAVILDVRTPAEVSQGRIAGAININLQDAEFRQKLSEMDPKTPVLVYCAAGIRSQSAAEMMQELGFTKVYNLENGLGTWTNAGYDIVQ